MLLGSWQTYTIAKDGTSGTAVDLGRDYEWLQVVVPTIDSATLTLQVSQDNSTFQNLHIIDPTVGDNNVVATAAGTGAITVLMPMGGFQYVKLVAGAAQSTAAVAFSLRGCNTSL